MVNRKKWNLIVFLGLLSAAALLLSGCDEPIMQKIQLNDLNNPEITVRVTAIKWAADNKNPKAIPILVGLLENEDRSVRFYSIQALKEITGTDNGYNYRSNATSRSAAVTRWKEYISKTDE